MPKDKSRPHQVVALALFASYTSWDSYVKEDGSSSHRPRRDFTISTQTLQIQVTNSDHLRPVPTLWLEQTWHQRDVTVV